MPSLRTEPGADLGDPLPLDRRLGRVFLLFGVVVLLVAAAAIALPIIESDAKAPSGLTAASAESTVRTFVSQAVVEENGYAACQLLTTAEGTAVAADGPGGDVCRVALGGATSLFGVSTAGDVQGLDLHADVRGRTATVTASAPGRQPVTFTLVPASGAEATTFGAASGPWRISAGAEHVLAGA